MTEQNKYNLSLSIGVIHILWGIFAAIMGMKFITGMGTLMKIMSTIYILGMYGLPIIIVVDVVLCIISTGKLVLSVLKVDYNSKTIIRLIYWVSLALLAVGEWSYLINNTGGHLT